MASLFNRSFIRISANIPFISQGKIMSTPFIIAIDGYSSCGKSTLARAAAAELDFVYVDSGAMYRAVTFYFLQKNIDLEDPEQISNALDDVQIELGTGKESEKVWMKNGRESVREKVCQNGENEVVGEVIKKKKK